jgi:hypothetical protein
MMSNLIFCVCICWRVFCLLALNLVTTQYETLVMLYEVFLM